MDPIPDTQPEIEAIVNPEIKDFSSANYLQTNYANYLIFSASILGLVYAFYCYQVLKKIEMTKDTIKVAPLSDRERDEIMAM